MKLDVIVPIYNEEESIQNFYNVITKTLENLNYNLIFVNDGSNDDSYNILSKLYINDKKHVKIINFSRNFGKEAAMYAGLSNAKSDFVCIIDADLQQDPKYILKMLDSLKEDENIDSVCMIQKQKKSRFFQKKFYKLINLISKTKFVDGASDFRMFRKYVVKNILKLSEKNRFSKGIFSWIGFNVLYLPYEVKKREKGKSKWNFIGLTKYAVEGFTGFSIAPLKISTYAGILISISAFIYLLVIIIKTLILGIDVPGYASIISLILFIGGIQLLCIGILGEYLGKSYLEIKNRPIYIEKERIGFDEENLL